MTVINWLQFLNTVLADMYSLSLRNYNIFDIFLSMSIISVVSTALVLRIKRGI